MSQVVLLNNTSYDVTELEQNLQRGIDLLGGWEQWLRPGMRVLLKPNLISPLPPEAAATTHPELVRALTRLLKKQGCEVWIGDSSGGAIIGRAVTAQTLKITGMEQVAAEEGAIIKNFDRHGTVPVQTGSEQILPTLHIAKPIREADFVINLPKLKTHMAATYTGAIKNLFGCIPGLRKAELHRLAPNQESFAQILLAINRACNIGLHIMDGIVAMEGAGPTAGSPRQVGAVLISPDALALDTVATKLIGIEPAKIPSLAVARAQNFGEGDLEKITLLGDQFSFPAVNDFNIPPGVPERSQTLFSFNYILHLLKTRPVIDKKSCKHCNICVGSCPVNAINKKTKNIDYTVCIECLCCHELCPQKAVQIKHTHFLGPTLLAISNSGRKLYSKWVGRRQ
ncbi:MAG: DUF362 domain-containing protein [bacterium]|jgi:uncharacterized protein (DUF362 family)/Pyruvate/2-oxoacid:ferredoxin oxidoreductase delta subunit